MTINRLKKTPHLLAVRGDDTKKNTTVLLAVRGGGTVRQLFLLWEQHLLLYL